MIKILHKAVKMLISVLIVKVTGALFKKAWKAAAHEDEVPKPTDPRVGWGEVVLAAALQAVLIAVVKAVIDRAAAEGTRKLTGVWVGEHADEAEARRAPAVAPAVAPVPRQAASASRH